MSTFTYDGKTIPFEAGESIIAACARAGVEIPHYCWHPGLSAPANCRMCLVEILPKPGTRPMMLDVLEWDASVKDYRPRQKPKLQPACQVSAGEGMEIKGETSDHVKQARKGVQEFLLLNHPVDCPICDQAGECKLQDYWLEHGGFQKRMRDEPVHKPKAVSFGATIVYDAERCVMCTRCVRFMREVAKDPVLDMRERGNLNEIFVSPGRELEGNYTFMTEHVCPVGALTTKDFRFKARVWFLKTADAVCQGCATGCNAYLDYDPRYNKAYRYRPRDNMAVNKFWMCDDGMRSYRAAHEGRVTEPLVLGKKASMAAALGRIKELLGSVPHDAIGVVLSAQHSLEDNWALRELATALLGAKALYVTGAPDGAADDILIHRDKNSNHAGVRMLAPGAAPFRSVKDGPFGGLLDDLRSGAVRHVIALGGDIPVPPAELSEAEHTLAQANLVVIAAHEGALTRAAKVVLPATSWAEHAGTTINAGGIRQLSAKALEPQGASKPAWQQVAAVAAALGLDPTWTKLKQIRSHLALDAAAADDNPAPAAE